MPKTSAAQGWSKKCVEHDSGKKLRWLQQWHEFKKYFPISRANASKAYTRVSQLGPSVPLGGHEAILRAPWSESFTKWLCRDIAKSYWWAGGHKCWEFLEGGHKQWKVEKHWSKPTYAKVEKNQKIHLDTNTLQARVMRVLHYQGMETNAVERWAPQSFAPSQTVFTILSFLTFNRRFEILSAIWVWK